MILEIKGLKKFYGNKENRVEVLKGIDLEVNEGEIYILLGPSGSGKSTLLNIIGGLEGYEDGEVILDGVSTKNMKERELEKFRRNFLGYVSQSYNLIPELNVEDNIRTGAYLGDNPMDIKELLETLGMTEHKDKVPGQLSGGQQQRTSIGRAIVKKPKLLLLDEPTGALDYNTSKDILGLLESVNRKFGMTMLMVTHNEGLSPMAHKVIHIKDGMIERIDINENPVSYKELEW